MESPVPSCANAAGVGRTRKQRVGPHRDEQQGAREGDAPRVAQLRSAAEGEGDPAGGAAAEDRQHNMGLVHGRMPEDVAPPYAKAMNEIDLMIFSG